MIGMPMGRRTLVLALLASALLALFAPAAGDAAAKSAPHALSTPPPEFPEHARRQRKSGFVVVAYTIGVDGHVGNVRIIESEPRGVFDHAVETALGRWRYEPPAEPVEITHTFYFDQ